MFAKLGRWWNGDSEYRVKALQRALRDSEKALEDAREIFAGKTPGYWSSDHYEEAKQCKGWVYAAVTTIADQCAQAEIHPKELKENQPDLYSILSQPNPEQSLSSFAYMRALQLCMTGTSVTWNVAGKNGAIVERYSIPTALIAPVPDGWRISLRAGAGVQWSEYPTKIFSLLNTTLPYEETSVVRFPHPWSLGDGLSPMGACSTWVDAANQIDESRYYANANSARPGGIFTEKEGIDAGPEDRERWMKQIQSSHAGTTNRGKNLYVPGPLDWQPWANTPIELDHFNSFEQMRDAIFAVYRVPPIAAGIRGADSHSSYFSALLQLTELRIQPILNLFSEEDRRVLESSYAVPEEFKYSARRIDDPDVIDKKVRLMKDTGAFSVNEIRAEMGKEPLPDAKYNLPLGAGDDDIILPGGEPMDETQTGIRM